MYSFKLIPIIFGISLIGCDNHQHINDTDNDIDTERTTPNSDSLQNQGVFISQLPDSAPTLKVSTIASGAPFVFKNEYGNVEGIDVDVIRAIGENQGFKVDFYTLPWENLFESVGSGERDLAIAGISYKEDRDQKYGLSDSYILNPSSIAYTNTNLTINGFKDLKGLKVGSLIGSKQMDDLKEMGEYRDIYEGQTQFSTYQQLVQGNVDAIVGDMPVLQYMASNNPEYNVKFFAYEDESTPEAQTVIMLNKNNTELLDKINAGIAAIKANGEMQAIENKWLNTEPL